MNSRTPIIALLVALLVAGAFLLTPKSALAGTVLAPSQFSALDDGDNQFPESRFGSPPAPPEPEPIRVSSGLPLDDSDGTARPSDRKVASVVLRHAPPAKAESDGASRSPSSAGGESARGVQEVALIAGDLGFFPKTVFVSRDVPVRMFVTGASKNTLCIMMDSFQVRKQIRSQKIEEIRFTPSVPGKYRFYCPVNGMEGTMIVKELASNLTQ